MPTTAPPALDGFLPAILARDAGAEGRVFFGVTTTGIFCRPTCPARRPRADRIRLFADPRQAQEAGFRACRRCRPDVAGSWRAGDALADRASSLLRRRASTRVTLRGLARELSTSPTQLHRAFVHRFALTPHAFLDQLRTQRVRRALRAGTSVRRAAAQAGFGSPNRLYGPRPRLGMTPGAYKAGGRAVEIWYATGASDLGALLVATTSKGVCAVRIGATPAALVEELRREFGEASLVADPARLQRVLEDVRARIAGRGGQGDVALDLEGTPFQQRVWRHLQAVPPGATTTYGELARRLGRPRAVRAVGRAVAANPAAVLVPCHRVVRADGGLGGFRWGVDRKRRMLAAERAGSAARA